MKRIILAILVVASSAVMMSACSRIDNPMDTGPRVRRLISPSERIAKDVLATRDEATAKSVKNDYIKRILFSRYIL